MKLKYDLVVPFGFNCVSAAQLRLRGLRVMSMPFDWVAWDGDNGFVNRLGMLQSNFKDWLNGDNLTVASLNGGDNHVVVYDRKYGISFPHDFVGGKIGTPPEPDELKRICEKYSRRASRMMDAIKGSDSVLFVITHDSGFVGIDVVRHIREKLQAVFPQKNIDIFCVSFDAIKYDTIMEDGIVIQYVARPMKVSYDVLIKSVEFSWLDGVVLTDKNKSFGERLRGKRQLKWYEKWIYSFAKKTLKILHKRRIKSPIIIDYE